ncbi:MAG: Crp/Fnr family transcriptional regulator [Saprospiraceae bacterium]|nr:Crp/Fnr family transcriptional regulator [Saprospiraceae bacterium]
MKTNCGNCIFKSSAVKSLNSNELVELSNNCVQIDFEKGDVIFKQGAISSNIIYLKSGLVKVHIKGPYKEQIINITKAPTYLGIPSCFNNKINEYSATAIEKADVCFIDVNLFKDFIYKGDEFAYEIIVELCRSNVNTYKKCVNRTQKQIHGRVAEALLFLHKDIYKNKNIDLPISRNEFASLVDTSRESICRILSQFNNDGIIKLSGNNCELLNEDLLIKISKNG